MPNENKEDVDKTLRSSARRAVNYTLTGVHAATLFGSASKNGWTSIHTAKLGTNLCLHILHELFEYFNLEEAATAIVVVNALFNIGSFAHELAQHELGELQTSEVNSSLAVDPSTLLTPHRLAEENAPPSPITFSYR